MYLESRMEEDRTPLILAGVFGASILLHILIFLFISFILPLWSRALPVPLEPQKMNIQLLKTPPPALGLQENSGQKQFVDTSESQPTTKPMPSPFEGEVSTTASSTQSGQGNAALPSQNGADLRGLTLRNQDYSPETEAKQAPQSNSTEQLQPKEQATPAEQAKQATTKELPQTIPLRSTGIIPTAEKPKNPDKKTQEATTLTQNTTSSQAIAPATFSAQKRTTQIEGGAQIGDSSSVGAQESEMGRYKAKLYRAIGSRWYLYIRQDSAQVSVGIVKIRFKVSSNGKISDLQIVEGSAHSGLEAQSRRSIIDLKDELDPFPPSMQEQIGDFYWEEVTFTIY